MALSIGMAITGPPACANTNASVVRTKVSCRNARIIEKAYASNAGGTSVYSRADRRPETEPKYHLRRDGIPSPVTEVTLTSEIDLGDPNW